MRGREPNRLRAFANSQIGHLADLIRPRVSTDLDFEGELAVIIGKSGRYISREDSWSYIAGYSLYNEGTGVATIAKALMVQ
ncbi:fumarylacetoacetate hydrolase family protein [Micromonospora sp. STR1s_5]|nr:fumarylacetoacetate hydrolase family protein [Micromonospora sp. STR1s_5]